MADDRRMLHIVRGLRNPSGFTFERGQCRVASYLGKGSRLHAYQQLSPPGSCDHRVPLGGRGVVGHSRATHGRPEFG